NVARSTVTTANLDSTDLEFRIWNAWYEFQILNLIVRSQHCPVMRLRLMRSNSIRDVVAGLARAERPADFFRAVAGDDGILHRCFNGGGLRLEPEMLEHE